jgi:L-serine dehydratase
MANEVAVSGKSEAEINAFVDKITTAMVNIVKSGLKAPSATLPGPIKLKTKAGDVYTRAMDDKYQAQRGVGVVAAYALAGSEENARGHLVVTAPTGGSAGVMPALVYVVGEGGRKLPQDKMRLDISASTTRRSPVPRAAARPRSAWRRQWAQPSSPRLTTSRRKWSRTQLSRRSNITWA